MKAVCRKYLYKFGLCAAVFPVHAVPADPYAALYNTIMVRKAADGSVPFPDPASPLLWNDSRYLVLDGGVRLVEALNAFNALSEKQLDAHAPVKRALLQHHLWAVFDWTTRVSNPKHETQKPVPLPASLQQALVSAIKKLALPEAEIRRLPDTLEATAKSGAYGSAHHAGEPLKPFLPRNLNDENGPWVCLRKSDHPLPAKVHTDGVSARSAFLVYLKLPGGRRDTLEYLTRLNNFARPWLPGKQPTAHNIAPHPATTSLELHVNPDTPQFPIGTRLALVNRALLISDQGNPVLSPLTKRIQVRAFLNVGLELKQYNHNPLVQGPPPGQAVSEFILQPKKLMGGKTPMRALAADEVHYATIFRHADPFQAGRKRVEPPRLNTCTACHSSAGIHSMNSRRELFQAGSLRPPRFIANDPSTIGKLTARYKRGTYSWGLLQGLWRTAP